MRQRLLKQAEHRGAYWNKTYKADCVAYVMPVTHRAAEAYVYYVLLDTLPAKSISKIGWWTQTSTSLSPLAMLLCQEARRNVAGACFTCGSKTHFAHECKSVPQVAHYPCKQCHNAIGVSARGQTPPASATTAPTPPLHAAIAHAPSALAAAASVEPAPKRRRVSCASSCLRVRVCGVAYTTLAWYLGETNPKSTSAPACNKRLHGQGGRDARWWR